MLLPNTSRFSACSLGLFASYHPIARGGSGGPTVAKPLRKVIHLQTTDETDDETNMASKPVIFTISAAWDDEAAVWTGHCDDIPAAADAPTLDELLVKMSAMALDLLPDNHPGVEPASVYLQITALREAEPTAA